MDIFPPALYQAVLTDFLREGHFARHLRKMRMIYRERRSALGEALRNEDLEVLGDRAGLHLVVSLPEGTGDRKISERAARQGLWVMPLSSCYSGEPSQPGLVLGFGGASVPDVEDGVQDGYARWDGTSFAAPMVSAAAAWLLADDPRLSADQVAEILRRSARDLGRPGWDIATGWGALDLGAAVRAGVPLNDPYEPNDDIRWVDGRTGFRPHPPFLRASAAQALRARLDIQKDPDDVYPVWVGPRERLDVAARPQYAAVRLSIHQPGARTVSRGRDLMATARIRPRRTGRVQVANSGRRGRKVWVSVYLPRGGGFLAPYDITLRRR